MEVTFVVDTMLKSGYLAQKFWDQMPSCRHPCRITTGPSYLS